MDRIICSTCQGLGEALVLSNPSDPDDASYETHGCPRCGGVGLVEPGQRAPIKVDYSANKRAMDSAVKAIQDEFKRRSLG